MAKLQPASQRMCDSVSLRWGFVCWRREGTAPSIYAADAYTSVKHIPRTVRHTFQMSSASNLFKNQLIHVSFECKIQPLLIKLDSVHHKQPHTSNCMGIHLYLTFFFSTIKVHKRPSPSSLPQTQISNVVTAGCNSPCSGTNLAPLQGAVKQLP